MADLALLAAAMALGACLVHERAIPRPPLWLLPALLLVLYSAFGGALLAVRGSSLPFSGHELLKSLAKLLFYVVAVTALSWAVARLGGAAWSEILLWALAVHAIVALYGYLAMHVDVLPPRGLWSEIRAVEAANNAVRFGSSVLRLRGLAAEPSNFGYFLSLGLAAVLLKGTWPRPRPWRELLALAALVLTFSLSAYLVAAAAGLLVVAARRQSLPRLLPAIGAIAAVALLSATLVPPARHAFTTAVLDRTAALVSGTADPAETKRLSGSWQPARMMVEASPWVGAGLGNYDVALVKLIDRLDPRLGMTVKDQGWMIPTYVLGTLGWPGLALLALLFAAALRQSWAGGLLVVVASFVDGTFLGAPFWVFYVLLAAAPAASLDRREAQASSAANASPAATSPIHPTAVLR